MSMLKIQNLTIIANATLVLNGLTSHTFMRQVPKLSLLLLTSVVFLPKSKYVANTSSYFACPKESSISLLVYPILARASKTNRCNGIVTTTKNTRTTRSIRHKKHVHYFSRLRTRDIYYINNYTKQDLNLLIYLYRIFCTHTHTHIYPRY